MTSSVDRRLHRDTVAVVALWCFGVCGLIVSLFLTILKVRAESLCSDDFMGACPAAAAGACATVLRSSWSTVANIPVTVYSAAYYLVVLGLAAATLVGPHTRVWTRPVLWVLAWAGAVVALGLWLNATLWLQALCRYCLFLDLVQCGILGAALLMNPWGWQTAASFVSSRRTRIVAGLAALTFITAISVQRRELLRVGNLARRDLSPCEVNLHVVPDSPLRLVPPRATPRLIAAVAIDFACPMCRQEFDQWQTIVRDAPNLPVEVRFFQYPATSCNLQTITSNALDLSPNRSCEAARALHCMIKLGPADQALYMAKILFQAQDLSTPYFTADRLANIANEFGIPADASRLSSQDPLFGCMAAPETAAALARDFRFAQDIARLTQPPGSLLIPLVDGKPTGSAHQVRGHKSRTTIETYLKTLLDTHEATP